MLCNNYMPYVTRGSQLLLIRVDEQILVRSDYSPFRRVWLGLLVTSWSGQHNMNKFVDSCIFYIGLVL